MALRFKSSALKTLSLFLLLTAALTTVSWGQLDSGWVQWSHWLATSQGQVWLKGTDGQSWLKNQSWLKTFAVEYTTPDIRKDMQWLKDQYLQQLNQQQVVTYPLWPKLPCLGYFNANYRQEALNRLFRLAFTQGDAVLFMGDSLTQMWTDSTANLQMPACGTVNNTGLYDWSSLPGVKVNMGLYGIRTCSWLYEYDRYFRDRTKPYANRIKSVVINLGSNDIIQLANDPNKKPKDEVIYIKQLIDELKVDLPYAQFVVTSISPCQNSLCGNYYDSQFRVKEFNNELVRVLQGYANRTVVQLINMQDSDLTMDKVHYNACGYQKTANAIRPWLSNMVRNTGAQSLPACPVANSSVHPCTLLNKK